LLNGQERTNHKRGGEKREKVVFSSATPTLFQKRGWSKTSSTRRRMERRVRVSYFLSESGRKKPTFFVGAGGGPGGSGGKSSSLAGKKRGVFRKPGN